MENDGELLVSVSISGLTLGGVSVGKGRVLNDPGAQSPPRAGVLTAHLTDSAGCATL